ncbi:LpqB family beta-propeller domain-containing protein [Streptomyces spiramyceticus]|uniref:LpqB family beta-propeller domain-containing protein n=1 Tax=Streptomyces spiramyceticus TaxID=299717 RepID=UPI00237ABD03|nr:LpqB family beta-propeller domain-containing protein [Streptomyces spiramyceticus]
MPDNGDVEAVDASPRGDSQVRVYGMAPRDGAQPNEIVEGFLEAMTGDDPEFATARKYLTKKVSQKWDPRQVTVLDNGPVPQADRSNDREGGAYTYALTGTKIAEVNEQRAYQPVKQAYRETIHLSRQNGPDGQEWRIDGLPPGLVLGESDFERIYTRVNKYYFASGTSSERTGAHPWLVADPVYVRKRMDPQTQMDPVTQTVEALLSGPTNWLKPVVGSSFPTGTALKLKEGTKSLVFDDRNALKVPLNGKASNVGQKRCREMAAQLLFTLRDLTSYRVGQVELQRSDNSTLCVLGGDQAEDFAPERASGSPDYQYFLDTKHRLVRMVGSAENTGSEDEAEPVPGPLGGGERLLGTVGVARDERRAAGVSKDARSLYVASIVSDSEPEKPVLTSGAKLEEDRLSAPSWDGRGDLWVADRDPRQPRLLRLAGGEGDPEEVRVVDGLDGARIEALKVSADGVRIALLVTEDGRTTLKLGRIERHGPDDSPEVSVVDLRPIAPQMEEVTAVSWAGRSRLVVVGRESGGVQQLRYLQTDGSTSDAQSVPGANRVTTVASADDDRLPLLAHSLEDGIVRLPPGANWKTVASKGSSPVYPG